MVWGPLHAYLLVSVRFGSLLRRSRLMETAQDYVLYMETAQDYVLYMETTQDCVLYMEMDTGLCTVHSTATEVILVYKVASLHRSSPRLDLLPNCSLLSPYHTSECLD